MRILITGSAGHTARALIAQLIAHPAQPEILLTDQHRPQFPPHPRVRIHVGDLRTLPWAQLLDGIDTVIHLGFVVLSPHLGRRRHWRAEMASVNRAGSLNLFRAAGRAGVAQVIYGSSVAVYGLGSGNPDPLAETAPLMVIPGFAYNEDKIAVEQALAALSPAYPETRFCCLRLHAVVGPEAQPLVNAIATSPWQMRLPDPELPVQCVHETDVATAIIRAWERHATGCYNIAAADTIPWSAIPRRWSLPLSPRQLHRMHRLLRPFTRRLGDPGWLLGLEQPLVVDTRRAQETLGWRASYSVSEALESLGISLSSSR